MGDWFSETENWWFLFIGLATLFSGLRVVTSRNVVHAVLFLVAALAGSAALFLLLGAEFVVWTIVLVYIGAVIVLFLFGIMITRAPLGREAELDHPLNVKLVSAAIAGALFLLMGGAFLDAFGADKVEPNIQRASDIGNLLFERYVIPFEVVSVVLLAALIGGIVLARRDPAPGEETP